VLADESGSAKWLTAAQALRLSTPDLSLPLRWNGDQQERDGLRPIGALMTVRLIPVLVDHRVYGPWINYASNIPHRPLHVFSYDWRRDNGETVQLFEQFLDGLRSRYGGKKPMVVAHSMGGMITLALWNRRPELIDRIVFAGVPFRGGIGYLDNMYQGTPAGLNGALLSPRVLFGYPSVYSFYPAGQPFESTDAVEDEQGRQLLLNFYDPATWRVNGFGPFAPQNSGWATQSADEAAFLAKALDRALAFRRQLAPVPGTAYRSALVVTSQKYPTLARMRRIRPSAGESVPRWDFEVAPKEPGDESVLARHAIPPEPIPNTVFMTDYNHSYLLNDPQVQHRIAEFLRE
jgi:pimeloyl-ACP methyl ester carboxylesterase